MNKNLKDRVDMTFNKVMLEYEKQPVDIFNTGNGLAEFNWMNSFMILSYKRTIYDIASYYENNDFSKIKILEIGPWLGIVAVVLKRLGFNIEVQDIPEFLNQKNLQNKFVSEQIKYKIINLKDYKLPYPDENYDAIIMCEVLEHLNFNPLPVFTEINRIIKLDGMLYISLPNLSFLANRIKLIFGKSIHGSIDNFFDQLLPNTSAIVGIHWREYTSYELKYLLNKMGFDIERHYYFHNASLRRKNYIKKYLLDFFYYLFPSCLPNQTAIAKKTKIPYYNFTITEIVR